MENKPLVSICVPTYNRPEGLKRTLNCLGNQTYTNIEVIVSDNGSTNPEVSNVLSFFERDARFKIYNQEINKGVFFNLNFIISKASGDFIMRLADDDWIDYGYIESCVDFLIRNPTYAAAYGRANIYDVDGSLIKQDVDLDLVSLNYQERLLNYFAKVEHNSIFYSVFRKEYYSYLIVKQKLGDDWLLISRILFLGQVKMLPNVESNIQLGGVSKSIDHIVTNFNLSKFVRYFPYLSIAFSLAKDIIFYSKAYKSIGLVKRLKLSIKCFWVIFHRFNIKDEILLRYKRRLESSNK